MSTNDPTTDLVLDLNALDDEDYDGEQPEYYDDDRNIHFRGSGRYVIGPEATAEYLADPRDCWSRPDDAAVEGGDGGASDGDSSDDDDGFDAASFITTEGRTVSGLRTALDSGAYDSADRLQAIAEAEANHEDRKTAYDALGRRARTVGIDIDRVGRHDENSEDGEDGEETDGGRTE
jgi:hypothetical protein